MTRIPDIPETPVAIDRTLDGRYDVYALTTDGIRSLGRFKSPSAAWHAIDAVDLETGAPALARAA